MIEILVAPGDTVAVDDPLITLESDKATMDVPAPPPGVVKALLVKVGDKVSEGSSLLTLDAEERARRSDARDQRCRRDHRRAGPRPPPTRAAGQRRGAIADRQREPHDRRPSPPPHASLAGGRCQRRPPLRYPVGAAHRARARRRHRGVHRHRPQGPDHAGGCRSSRSPRRRRPRRGRRLRRTRPGAVADRRLRQVRARRARRRSRIQKISARTSLATGR